MDIAPVLRFSPTAYGWARSLLLLTAGVAAVLFTDIDGDGLLQGVNVTATAALARALSIPVIASGGVGSIADIDALLAANEPNIEGVVVGRALYDGRIDVAEALRRTK